MRRPYLSPIYPKIRAPIGYAKKPTEKTKYAERRAAIGSEEGKNIGIRTGRSIVNKEKEYISSKFPMDAAKIILFVIGKVLFLGIFSNFLQGMI